MTKLALILVVLASLVGASAAQAATPTSPANGTQLIEADNVILSWVNPPGWNTYCIEWSTRPETRYADGPFLAPDGGDCASGGGDIGRNDTSVLLSPLLLHHYYWHVASYMVPLDQNGWPWYSAEQIGYGPTAYFDNVEQAQPPAQTYLGVNCGASTGDKIRPSTYYPNCASASWPAAHKLKWRGWGTSQAVGTGVIDVPYFFSRRDSFADAKDLRLKGHITAYRPRYCADGTRKYTRVTFVTRAPRRLASGRVRIPPMPLKANLDICDDGEPTVSSTPPE